MGVADIDKLQIEIEATSADATKRLNELIDTLGRLKSTSNVGGAFGNLKKQISGIGSSADKASKSFGVLKSVIKGLGLRQIASYIGGAVASINEYVETVNLFQVSMGEFYDEAMAYSRLVSDKMGVDPAQWMRSQGVFMSMAKGFGMTKEQAYDLSESLTELSYDIGSLYNEDVESAATRLQSALAGEIEPIRRLGISISQATLQEYALSKGINESVSSMTEQEKALLRSLKLIEGAGSIGAIGDFAKTLESPANAIRILKQQFVQLGRAIGSVFLPIVVQAIPYIQAFMSVLTDMISALATFVGFKIPEWDNKSWDANFSGAADAVDDTTAAVKKLKTATVGIDELNIISPDTGSGAGDGGISGWASGLEIPDLWNKDDIAAINTEAEKLKGVMGTILELALLIGAAFAGWKIGTALAALGGIGAALAPVAAILPLLVARFADLVANNEDFRKGIERVGQVFGAVFGVAKDILSGVFKVVKDIAVGLYNLLPEPVKNIITGGIQAIREVVQESNVDFTDLGLVALGFAALFVPGGQIVGAVILGFEAITLLIRSLGSISDETWNAMAEKANQVWSDVTGFFSEMWKVLTKDAKDFVTKTVPGYANNLISLFENLVNHIIGAWNGLKKALNSLQFTLPDWLGGGKFGFHFEMTELLKLPRFADGGFPDHGQMFIARESGPELVGQIGQRTAVANTNQIVDGISVGVMNANAEQNALLMEQNELLRAILAKEGTTYLDGKALKRSLDRAGRNAGASIMAGGVMAR